MPTPSMYRHECALCESVVEHEDSQLDDWSYRVRIPDLVVGFGRATNKGDLCPACADIIAAAVCVCVPPDRRADRARRLVDGSPHLRGLSKQRWPEGE